jgi:hypothetical protein
MNYLDDLKMFQDWILEQGYSTATAKTYRSRVKTTLEDNGQPEYDSIDHDWLAACAAGARTAVRLFLDWAAENNILKKNRLRIPLGEYPHQEEFMAWMEARGFSQNYRYSLHHALRKLAGPFEQITGVEFSAANLSQERVETVGRNPIEPLGLSHL